MAEDKFEFDSTCRYGLRILWKPIKPTRLEIDATKFLSPSTRSQVLKYVRQSIAEIIPRGFRSRVKIHSGVMTNDSQQWRFFEWNYNPRSKA